ncbi:MAG: hypothetical protein ACRYGP_23345 [Janthinobacterium lividum]
MTSSKILSVAVAASLLTATAAPAFAVSVKHTSRVDGDPAAALTPSGHSAPPVDSSPIHALDKAHETGAIR